MDGRKLYGIKVIEPDIMNEQNTSRNILRNLDTFFIPTGAIRNIGKQVDNKCFQTFALGYDLYKAFVWIYVLGKVVSDFIVN